MSANCTAKNYYICKNHWSKLCFKRVLQKCLKRSFCVKKESHGDQVKELCLLSIVHVFNILDDDARQSKSPHYARRSHEI